MCTTYYQIKDKAVASPYLIVKFYFFYFLKSNQNLQLSNFKQQKNHPNIKYHTFQTGLLLRHRGVFDKPNKQNQATYLYLTNQ